MPLLFEVFRGNLAILRGNLAILRGNLASTEKSAAGKVG